jgi:hypothetical protein
VARYYLRPTGDDAAEGTSPRRAWKTLQRASRAPLQPGDSLSLEGGATFPGTLVLSHAGTPGQPIRIGSFGRGRATIAAGRAVGITAHDVAGIRIENLVVVGDGRDKGNRASGISFSTTLPGGVKLTHLRIERVAVHGFGEAGITIFARASDESRSGFRDIRIVGVDAYDNGDAGVSFWGGYRTDLPGWAHESIVIERCRTFRNRGIAGKGSHSGNGIVLGQVDDARITRCIASENGENSDYEGGGPVGIWAWDSNRVVIEHCESHNNRSKTRDGGGFDLDGGVTNSVLRFNRSHDNAGAGFMIYQFSGARPCFGNRVHNNVSANDGRTNLGGLFAGGGIQGAQFSNNRVLITPRSTDTYGDAFGAGTDDVDNGTVIFRDNRIVTRGGALLLRVMDGPGTVLLQRNALQALGAFALLWRGVRHDSLDAWQRHRPPES